MRGQSARSLAGRPGSGEAPRRLIGQSMLLPRQELLRCSSGRPLPAIARERAQKGTHARLPTPAHAAAWAVRMCTPLLLRALKSRTASSLALPAPNTPGQPAPCSPSRSAPQRPRSGTRAGECHVPHARLSSLLARPPGAPGRARRARSSRPRNAPAAAAAPAAQTPRSAALRRSSPGCCGPPAAARQTPAARLREPRAALAGRPRHSSLPLLPLRRHPRLLIAAKGVHAASCDSMSACCGRAATAAQWRPPTRTAGLGRRRGRSQRSSARVPARC